MARSARAGVVGILLVDTLTPSDCSEAAAVSVPAVSSRPRSMLILYTCMCVALFPPFQGNHFERKDGWKTAFTTQLRNTWTHDVQLSNCTNGFFSFFPFFLVFLRTFFWFDLYSRNPPSQWAKKKKFTHYVSKSVSTRRPANGNRECSEVPVILWVSDWLLCSRTRRTRSGHAEHITMCSNTYM